MMNGMQAVTELAIYLSKNISDIEIFKFKKPTNYALPYICLNYLPINYGQWVNSTGVVNVNIHVPDLESELPDTKKLQEIAERVMGLIPKRNSTTEDDEAELIINHHWYYLEADSNCIGDNDKTHFINLRIQVTFTE